MATCPAVGERRLAGPPLRSSPSSSPQPHGTLHADQSLPRGGSGSSLRRFRHRTEFTRNKDVFRHLQPWEATHKPAGITRNAFSTPSTPGDAPSPALDMCPDSALAAFAQLGALRLRARRCLITLVSSDTEYVLADITKTTSLQDNALAEGPRDAVWIGTSRFPRAEGVSGMAVDEWRTARSSRTVPAEQDHYYTQGVDQHCSIVNDMRSCPRRRGSTFFQRGPWIRFYASVPLRGAQGSVIGALTVLDDEPRFGLSALNMAFLEDLSDTVVEHLDATIVRSQCQRGERLIQGIGLFNVGKYSLRDWWLSQDDSRVLRQGRHADKGTALERQARVDAEFGIEADLDDENDDDVTAPAPAGADQVGADYFGRGPARDPRPRPHPKLDGAVAARPVQPLPTRPHPRRSGPTKKSNNDFDLASASADAFARASSLLREATGADGVVFANTNKVPASLSRDNSRDSAQHGSNDTLSKRSSDVDGSDSGLDGADVCSIQGFANRTHSSVAGFDADLCRFTLAEHGLQRLVKRYPKGVVFHFDASGQSHWSSSDEASGTSSGENSDPERKRKRRDGQLLAKAIKGARTVALLPLRDDQSDRWRSCAFAWSTSSNRYFDTSEDLTYLTTFGHSLMATLARHESHAADKAKGTFISSISHELRSPLHGIMAGVDFIQETDLTAYQQEMTDTIGMAARTLLDTINHILDYSKISRHARAMRPEASHLRVTGPPSSSGASLDDTGGTPIVDLARLTEEVVETTVTAHRSQYHTPLTPGVESGADRNLQRRATFADGKSPGVDRVSVTLNMDHLENWNVSIEPGAWTRVITNLLGNALKYTAAGQISVGLDVNSALPLEDPRTALVRLTVKDTGIGISESFQANGLFTPFRQEDPHSVGTGLGLSIVKQIVHELGADLHISSEPGEGTEVSVTFPANFVLTDALSSAAEDLPPAHLNLDRFHLLSTELTNATVESGVGDSVLRLAEAWTGCSPHHGVQEDLPACRSVCAIAEDHLSALKAASSDLPLLMLAKAAQQHSHILVLGSSIRSLSLSSWDSRFPISPVFVHQPIGPRKLIRAIASDHDSTSTRGKLQRERSSFSANPVLSPDSIGRSESRPISGAESRETTPSRPAWSRVASQHSGRNPGPPSPWHARQDSPSATSEGNASSSTHPAVNTLPIPTTPSAESSLSGMLPSLSEHSHDLQCVLLVEDNDINMTLLVHLMKKLNVGYRTARHGREAIDMFRAAPHDFFLVLMDMNMPVMDGFTCTAKIRAFEKRGRDRSRRARIVALTGSTSAEARDRAFGCGVDEFHSKPVKLKELAQLVDRARHPVGESSGVDAT